MTEQEFREALKRSLSGADLPDCRKHQALAQMKGDPSMKKRTKFRFAFVLLAIVLLTTATGAIAASMFKGTVDWHGQPKVDETISMTVATETQAVIAPMPAVTPMPKVDTQPANSIERIIAIQTLLNEEAQKAEGDLIIVSEKDDDPYSSLTSRRSTVQRFVSIATYEELQERIAQTTLPLPAALPEGYDISELRIDFDCRFEGEYTPISTTERTLPLDGSSVVVTRYRASEEHNFISGYLISMENSEGETMYITTELTRNAGNLDFGLWDDEEATAVEVPGMLNALLIEGSARNQLFMHRPMPEPIDIISILHPDAMGSDRFDSLDDLVIQIHATDLDGDALLSIFAQ